MLDMHHLAQQNCQPLNINSPAMIIPTIESYLSVLHSWQPAFDFKSIERTISFKNHYQLMAFLNAIAFISHQQDYYPNIQYAYNEVNINLTSNIAKGLTVNDMIFAAKINLLVTHG